jgi:adenosylcobinamide-GDP ribazoletransferase
MRRTFLLALSTLSRVPTPFLSGVTTAELVSSAVWYPVVGALLGALLGLPAQMAAENGAPMGLIAAVTLLAGALLTGGLHEDGLADSADGLGGGRDKAHALEIMRDSRIGSYGALALLLVVLSRLEALRATDPTALAAGLIQAFTLSRLAALGLMATLPPARADDPRLAAQLIRDTGPRHLFLGLLLAVLCLAPLADPAVALVAGVCLGATALLRGYFRRRLDGLTGDLIGAATILVEAVALGTWALLHGVR